MTDHTVVPVPQQLWEDVIDLLEFPYRFTPVQQEDLMRRIRQHFDGHDC